MTRPNRSASSPPPPTPHPSIPRPPALGPPAEREVPTQIPPVVPDTSPERAAGLQPEVDRPSIGTLEQLQAADEAMRRRKAEEARHNSLCPALRRGECTCAANLKTHAVQLKDPAAKRVGTLVQVHPGGPSSRLVYDKTLKKDVPVPWKQPPRWVCGECGWATRGDDVGHRCVPAEVAVAQAPDPLHYRVSVEKRFAGGYLLAVHRTLEGYYVLEELIVEEGRVLARATLGEPEQWDTVQARLTSEVVERFTP